MKKVINDHHDKFWKRGKKPTKKVMEEAIEI